jgi:hypothetical protein
VVFRHQSQDARVDRWFQIFLSHGLHTEDLVMKDGGDLNPSIAGLCVCVCLSGLTLARQEL